MFRCFLCVLVQDFTADWKLPHSISSRSLFPVKQRSPFTVLPTFSDRQHSASHLLPQRQIVAAVVLPHFDLQFSSQGKSDYWSAVDVPRGYNPAKGLCFFLTILWWSSHGLLSLYEVYTEVIVSLAREDKKSCIWSAKTQKKKLLPLVWHKQKHLIWKKKWTYVSIELSNEQSTVTFLGVSGGIFDASCEYK